MTPYLLLIFAAAFLSGVLIGISIMYAVDIMARWEKGQPAPDLPMSERPGLRPRVVWQGDKVDEGTK